jgi:hypothetical protein
MYEMRVLGALFETCLILKLYQIAFTTSISATSLLLKTYYDTWLHYGPTDSVGWHMSHSNLGLLCLRIQNVQLQMTLEPLEVLHEALARCQISEHVRYKSSNIEARGLQYVHSDWNLA